MKKSKVVIIGSGPAGCTAAIYAARANLNPLVITGEQQGGQLIQTPDIQNWPGEVAISGFELMDKLMNHAKSFGVEFESDQIVAVDFSKRPFVLTGDGNTYEADAVIIATGASPKYLGLPSEEQFKGNGVSACATCDGFFYRDQNVAVIGGGSTALTEALYLSNICKKVSLVHRRSEFRAEKILVDQVLEKAKNGNIELVLDSQVQEILGTDDNGVEAITVKNKNNEIQKIDVAGVFMAIGHTPNTSVFASSLKSNNGTLIVGCDSNYATSCSVSGVFAAGDCADEVYRQAITSAGTGCKAALDVEKFLQQNPL